MARLDWGKASLREFDPARVQRTADFTIPDKVSKKAKRKRSKTAKAKRSGASHTVAFEAAVRGYLSMLNGKPEVEKAPKVAKRRKAKKTVAKVKSRMATKAKPSTPHFTQPIDIDTHLTEKPLRDAARAKAVRPKRQAKLPKVEQQAKKAKPTKAATSPKEARRQAEREARKLRPAALEKVIVVRRVGGEIKSVRKLGQ
jgi:hypothetical protein